MPASQIPLAAHRRARQHGGNLPLALRKLCASVAVTLKMICVAPPPPAAATPSAPSARASAAGSPRCPPRPSAPCRRPSENRSAPKPRRHRRRRSSSPSPPKASPDRQPAPIEQSFQRLQCPPKAQSPSAAVAEAAQHILQAPCRRCVAAVQRPGQRRPERARPPPPDHRSAIGVNSHPPASAIAAENPISSSFHSLPPR